MPISSHLPCSPCIISSPCPRYATKWKREVVCGCRSGDDSQDIIGLRRAWAWPRAYSGSCSIQGSCSIGSVDVSESSGSDGETASESADLRRSYPVAFLFSLPTARTAIGAYAIYSIVISFLGARRPVNPALRSRARGYASECFVVGAWFVNED